MKTDVKDLLELMFINFKHTKENYKNLEAVKGYLDCIQDIIELPQLYEFPELFEYKDRVKKEIDLLDSGV